MGYVLLLLLPLLLMGIYTETVHFKGNLLFKEFGTNYLNQEPLILSRRLETADLEIFAQILQASADLYMSFCDSIKRLYFQLNPEKEIPAGFDPAKNFTYIVSTTKYPLSQSAPVCRTLSARLPEVRSNSDDHDLKTQMDKFNVKVIMTNIQFDVKGQRFFWESDLTDVAQNNVYNDPYYGGRNTKHWYQANTWRDPNLLQDGANYFMTIVRARDGLAFRLSDSETVNRESFIICQKPVPKTSISLNVETSILIQLTKGDCERDLDSVINATRKSIDQIALITSIKVNARGNDSILKDYLPKFGNNQRRKRSIKKLSKLTPLPPIPYPPSTPCRTLKTASDLWGPLFIENYFKSPLTFSPPLDSTFSAFFNKCYQFWFYLQTRKLTNEHFHDWLDNEIRNSNISYCSKTIEHMDFQSNERFYDTVCPDSIQLFKSNLKTISIDEPFDPFTLNDEHRKERDLNAMTSATVIGSLIGGAAYVIKSFIDVLSINRYASIKDFNKLSHQVADLRVNQIELQTVIKQIAQRMDKYEQDLNNIVKGMTAKSLETDLKNFNRYLQSILGNTLSNYAQAFLAASDHKTSPFALSQIELHQFANKFHSERRMFLETNLSKIRTTAVVIDNSIFFFFEVPIISDEFFFTFFSITKVPAFDKNITYWPDLVDNNIAISKNGMRYTILTTTELDRCMDNPPVCKSSHPISPTSNIESCAITTFVTSKRTCPLRPATPQSPPRPFFYFTDTSLFYSVPYNTTLFISCQPPSSIISDIQPSTQQSVTISGMGEAQYRPACTISFADGTFYKTPARQEIVNLTDWPLFNIKAVLPHIFEHTITMPSTLPPLDFSNIGKTDNDDDNNSIWSTSNNYLAENALNISIALAPLACALILALCFWKQLKSWFNKQPQPNTEITKSVPTKDEFEFISLTPSRERSTSFSAEPQKSFHSSLPFPIYPNLKNQASSENEVSSPNPPILKKASSQKNVQFQFHA